MALSAQHLAYLATELASSDYDNKTSDEGFSYLHSPIVTVTQSVKPKSLSIEAVLQLVSVEHLTMLVDNPSLLDIRDMIQRQDREGVARWAGILYATGYLSGSEVASISAAMQETEAVNISTAHSPPIATRFSGSRFPGISGFPNAVERSDFNLAWTQAGRS